MWKCSREKKWTGEKNEDEIKKRRKIVKNKD